MDKEFVPVVVENSAEKKTSYTALDAFIVFLITMVAMILLSAFVTGIAVFITMLELNDAAAEVGTVLSSILLFFVFIFIFVQFNKKNNYNYIVASSVKKDVNIKNIIIVVAMAVACLFLVTPAISSIMMLFEKVGYNISGDMGFETTGQWWRLVVGLFVFALLPAIGEELIFRGIILKGLLSKFKPYVAILISALMFMLIHGSLQQTFYQFILGVVLGVIVFYSGNIIYAIIFHFCNNAIILTVSFFVAQAAEMEVALKFVLASFVQELVLAGVVIYMIIFYARYLTPQKNRNVTDPKNMFPSLLQGDKFDLQPREKFYFFAGLSVAVVLWLSATYMGFF